MSDYQHFPTQYWTRLSDGRVRCELCPHLCQLRDGKRGICYIRKAEHGQIVLTSYGRSSGFCIDPIEKKPLNHFLPGSTVLSFGTAGCNLGCKFCQNWHISKSRQWDSLAKTAEPEQIAQAAADRGCASVAFTYNDPVIFMEYAVDVAKACHGRNVKTVAVSAGYINDAPRREFFSHIDAANIDLKGFSDTFYRKLCGGHLAPVLDTLTYLKHETSVWFEITTLLIPGLNDDATELTKMCQWIVDELGVDVPLHFSAFHPDFKLLDLPPTPLETLLKARQIAFDCGIRYVYVGNVHCAAAASTQCPYCGKPLIERDWYQLGAYQLTSSGCCHFCHRKIAGVFGKPPHQSGYQSIAIHI